MAATSSTSAPVKYSRFQLITFNFLALDRLVNLLYLLA
jgi:hypothetical protein